MPETLRRLLLIAEKVVDLTEIVGYCHCIQHSTQHPLAFEVFMRVRKAEWLDAARPLDSERRRSGAHVDDERAPN